ncbi:hypothetical protein Pmani_024548 [Petrolisthes manimaculis]|uniref:Uncharacterized protein n=1 Tax=Petrolisthes manimaculis TaxID=1843537 RepID=A0AAE1P792_9EUCA|nr:hypothetical protein Pmani_024548 [Petrolisthes manimaculis]
MRVSVGGSLSNNVPITSGVPQGSVLGPLLFLIYVNYIGSSLTCKYMMFADDLKLFLHHPGDPSSPASAILQFNIDTLAATASSWGLKFAPGKCVHLCFRRGLGGPFNHEYYLDGIALNQASSHKDLGVMVDNKLRFHPHIRQTVAGAGGEASNLLKSRVCRSLSFMKTLFISDVRPLLDFASPVWNPGFLGDMRLLESVQRRWTKQVGDMSLLPYPERLKRLDLFSTNGRLLRLDLILCYNIFHDMSVIKPYDLFVMAPHCGTRGHPLKILHPRFPKDEEVQCKWIHLCKRDGEVNPSHARICSRHFEESAYERNIKYELLGLPVPSNQRRLNSGALPTLHMPTTSEGVASGAILEDTEERRIGKRQRLQDSDSTENADLSAEERGRTSGEHIQLSNCCHRTQLQSAYWKEQFDSACCKIDSMLHDRPVKYWQDEGICKALTLQSLSPKGYRYLREVIKLPLPSEAAEDLEEECSLSAMAVSALDWQEPLTEGQYNENTDDPYFPGECWLVDHTV